jgi:hypothetical protein
VARKKPYLVARPRGRLSDDKLMRRVLEKMWPRVDIYRGSSKLKEGLARATAGQVAVYATWFSDSEICNGGFHQFFSNPTGILYREALAGFERIGAKRYAKLLATAGALLGKTVPRDHERRNARLERMTYDDWEARIAATERRYYAMRSGPQALEGHAARYIRAHEDEFFIHA